MRDETVEANQKIKMIEDDENGDELHKLEMMLRPQSVPMWMNGNEDRPKVPNIKPRRQIEEVETLEGGKRQAGQRYARPRAPFLKPHNKNEENSSTSTRRRRKGGNKDCS